MLMGVNCLYLEETVQFWHPSEYKLHSGGDGTMG